MYGADLTFDTGNYNHACQSSMLYPAGLEKKPSTDETSSSTSTMDAWQARLGRAVDSFQDLSPSQKAWVVVVGIIAVLALPR